jgi:hypothetical protein
MNAAFTASARKQSAPPIKATAFLAVDAARLRRSIRNNAIEMNPKTAAMCDSRNRYEPKPEAGRTTAEKSGTKLIRARASDQVLRGNSTVNKRYLLVDRR